LLGAIVASASRSTMSWFDLEGALHHARQYLPPQ